MFKCLLFILDFKSHLFVFNHPGILLLDLSIIYFALLFPFFTTYFDSSFDLYQVNLTLTSCYLKYGRTTQSIISYPQNEERKAKEQWENKTHEFYPQL